MDVKQNKTMPQPEKVEVVLESSKKEIEPPKVVIEKPIQVVALLKGFYKQTRIEPGDKFTIDGEKQFSKFWMKKI